MTAIGCQLDHLVVAAPTLDAGLVHVEKALGVTVPFGGQHPLMGTHNALMQLGSTCFLEVIAINPEASDPGRPRWYALDDPDVQKRLAERPCLLTWVCRTNDITSAVDASLIDTGPAIEGRRGNLVWQITVPDDGSLPEGGLFPTLLQWPESLGENGPIPRMPDLGCKLEKLELAGPDPERLKNAISSIGFEGPVEIHKDERPRLRAQIRTGSGLRSLD